MSEQATLMVFSISNRGRTRRIIWRGHGKSICPPNRLSSVTSFEVFKGLKMLGQQSASPWDYFEVIRIASETQFLQESQSAQT